MDRHICKAKRKDNGEWVQGYLFYDNIDCMYRIITDVQYSTGTFADVVSHRVISDTICQCIGWHDTNNTPIFEKDIIEFVGASTYRYLIWWCNEMNMMDAVPLDGIKFNGYDYWNGKCSKFHYTDFCFMMQDPYGDFKEIKVIGNIIDNPELLEA